MIKHKYVLVLAFHVVLSAYVGICAWFAGTTVAAIPSTVGAAIRDTVYMDGIPFQNEDEVRKYIRLSKAPAALGWALNLPDAFLPLVCAVAFGWLGGAGHCVFGWRKSHAALHPISAVLDAPVGGFFGLAIFLLSFCATPLIFLDPEPVRIEGIAGLSLIAGAFLDHAHAWLRAKVDEFFKIR